MKRIHVIPVLFACLALLSSCSKSGGEASAGPAMHASIKASDCLTCHKMDAKLVGPSFKEIAVKYSGDAKAVPMLVEKVKAGGKGNWGEIPMTPHPKLADAQIEIMVKWILEQK